MDTEFIPCSSKYLPIDLAFEAAATAVEQNPVNAPSMSAVASIGGVLPPERIALMTSKYWSNKGVHLTVGFMEQTSAALANKILEHMNAWSEFANVQFSLSNTDPQVRISTGVGGYWSYLGTDILHIPANQQTMNLERFTLNTPDSEYKRVVRHETGHTLGFVHEHMRRDIVSLLDTDRTISYFMQTQGWSRAMVMQQVLTPLDEASLMATPIADQLSIMTYALPGIITKSGQPIIGGTDIEDQDAAFVAKIYPKASVPTPPPKPIGSKVFSFSVDDDAKRISFSAPSGYTLVKGSTNSGGQEMSQQQLCALADELEAAMPTIPAEAQATLGGLFGSITKLIAAVRSSDYSAALSAFIELLQNIQGTATPPATDGTISFALGDRLGKINWGNILGILSKFLPLILGA